MNNFGAMNDPASWLSESTGLPAMNDRQAWLSGVKQEPWWKTTQDTIKNPNQQIMMSLLAQRLANAGHNLAGGNPAPLQRPTGLIPGFDLYGNPVA